MNIAEGVTPDLQKEGTIQEGSTNGDLNYENDMTRVYPLNADCETVKIDAEINIEGEYDVLKIGQNTYDGTLQPFTVKLSLAFTFAHNRCLDFHQKRMGALNLTHIAFNPRGLTHHSQKQCV